MQFLINLLILIIIAKVIGDQRLNSGKELGFRSLALIILGAYCFTYLSGRMIGVYDWHVIANIVSGISFVGAGLIIKDSSIKNLTTAILVWTSTAIGILLGLNMILESIIISITIYLILIYKN